MKYKIDIYSYSSYDYKICRKKHTPDHPYGYGFIKWEEKEMCISKVYYDDRHGLGFYRWANNEEFILDETTFNLTYKTNYDNVRNYLFNNCFMV